MACQWALMTLESCSCLCSFTICYILFSFQPSLQKDRIKQTTPMFLVIPTSSRANYPGFFLPSRVLFTTCTLSELSAYLLSTSPSLSVSFMKEAPVLFSTAFQGPEKTLTEQALNISLMHYKAKLNFRVWHFSGPGGLWGAVARRRWVKVSL